MGSQQSRQPIAQDEMPHDSLSPPPPIPDQTSEVVSPTAVHTTVHEDTRAPWIVSSSVLGS
ncbi:hypothetical protein AAG906_029247 [Vitis piasezkii]